MAWGDTWEDIAETLFEIPGEFEVDIDEAGHGMVDLELLARHMRAALIELELEMVPHEVHGNHHLKIWRCRVYKELWRFLNDEIIVVNPRKPVKRKRARTRKPG